MKRKLLILWLALTTVSSYAQDGAPVWTNLFNNSLGGRDSTANAMAVDTNGNIFVTGARSDSCSRQRSRRGAPPARTGGSEGRAATAIVSLLGRGFANPQDIHPRSGDHLEAGGGAIGKPDDDPKMKNENLRRCVLANQARRNHTDCIGQLVIGYLAMAQLQ